MIPNERIQALNTKDIVNRPYVLYWMQSAQRVVYNHALEYAVRTANTLQKPLLVFFGITENFPQANERHYCFMLEGLREVKAALAQRNIGMLIRRISPEIGALALSDDAALIVVDRGYLRIERTWRKHVADLAPCLVVQVETNVIVPVQTASSKEEYAARTLRPRIERLLPDFAQPLEAHAVNISSTHLPLSLTPFAIEDTHAALNLLHVDKTVKPYTRVLGGTSQAESLLREFIGNKLHRYAAQKNDPGYDATSNLSPYLHFGQISPLYIYLQLMDTPLEARKVFLEEVIVRRELSMNFVLYNSFYDTYDSIPDWAKATLAKHGGDLRAYRYTRSALEEAKTHDPYWNAAQREMLVTGKMNGYMRMYWGKKILEWCDTPQEAYQTAVYLNNRYNLDGRDPNAYAGIAWCFGKHDRPWKEREVFGTVRYMNARGLERKFDMQRYLDRVKRLTEQATPE